MQLSIFQVDAFTARTFGGDPAAVVPLPEWLPDETMQAIALENNLSETALVVPSDRFVPLHKARLELAQEFVQSNDALGLRQRRSVTRIANGHQASLHAADIRATMSAIAIEDRINWNRGNK